MGRLDASFVANDRPEVSFYVSDSFDPTAAGRLCEKIRSLPARWRVVVDFRQAREVSILALGLLAMTLSAPDVPHATVCGLPRHLQRMVAYLGSTPAPREDA